MNIDIDEAERMMFIKVVRLKLQKEIQNPKCTKKRLEQLYRSEAKLKKGRKELK